MSRAPTPTQELWWPPEWRRGLLAGWAAVAFGCVVVAVFLASAVTALWRGSVIIGSGLTGIAVVLAPIVLSNVPRTGRAEPEAVEIDVGGAVQSAVRFRMRPPSLIVSAAAIILGFAEIAIAAAFVVVGMDWATTFGEVTDDRPVGLVVFLVLAGGALAGPGLAFLVLGIAGFRHARRGLGIYLSADQVVVDQGRGRTMIAWNELAGVRAVRTRPGIRAIGAGPLGRRQNWIMLDVPELATASAWRGALGVVAQALPGVIEPNVVAVHVRRLESDPALVYNALWHYFDEPDDRRELASGAALKRLAAGQL